MSIYEYMEDPAQIQKTTHKSRSDAKVAHREKQKPNATLPLMITLIGIFCYLGVVLPSVFEPSARFFNYSAFDILLMIGSASLVGLGAYFWFKARTKLFRGDEGKAIDLA